MAKNGKKWLGRVLSPARLLPLATVPRVHLTLWVPILILILILPHP
jgi:hypothetical protein